MRKIVALTIMLLGGVLLQPLHAQTVPVSGTTTADVEALNGLDAFIAEVMETWNVPGLALAIVQDSAVVHAEGYGYRDVEQELPVTPQTLFAIGSITKSFTVTAMGVLADEGKLDWDEPVRTYLPDFTLYDEVATEHMTPRDLVTHRSGLPRHDLLWYGSDFSRRDLYERLRYLEPTEDFRSVWQYQNLMFMTAGYLAGHLAGMTWEDLVRQRILQPLGMAHSNFSVEDSKQADDFALPYVEIEDEVKRVPFRNIDEIGPAGSINSSVEEMIRYVMLHIYQGKHGEESLFSADVARQMQMPQMVIRGTIQDDELGHNSYGMGLSIGSYRGRKVVQHGGGIDGFIALLSFMPRKKMGMIILTNKSGNNPVPAIVSRNVYDRLLELDPVDWAGRIQARQEQAEQGDEDTGGEASFRVEGTTPSHALADYAGAYEHPGYGLVDVTVEDSALTIRYSSFTATLAHVHYDVFEAGEEPMNPLSEMKVTFLYNSRGEIDRVTVPFQPGVDDIVFTRRPDEAMRARSFLEPFVGAYEAMGLTVTVAFKGDDTLILTVPGQPTYELEPARGTTFDLKGLTGYSVEFKQEGDAVTQMVVYQPDGTFVATRK